MELGRRAGQSSPWAGPLLCRNVTGQEAEPSRGLWLGSLTAPRPKCPQQPFSRGSPNGDRSTAVAQHERPGAAAGREEDQEAHPVRPELPSGAIPTCPLGEKLWLRPELLRVDSAWEGPR